MKSSYLLVAFGIVGILFGYGLTAAVTSAQLGQIANSAETLELSPTTTPTRNLHQDGGSCG